MASGEIQEVREHVIRIPGKGESSTVLSLARELQFLDHDQRQNKSSPFSRVRPIVRNGNEAACTRKYVSIGPYHHANEELKNTQEVKKKYLRDLIQRSPRNSLRNYIEIVKAQAEEAMKLYDGGIDPVNPEEFVNMMVVDGCFIIEFLVRWYINNKMGQMNTVRMNLPSLRNDLLLVENQIPFNILEALFKESDIRQFNVMNEKNEDVPSVTITELALFYFLDDRVCAQWMAEAFNDIQYFDHLLDLYHSSLYPNNHRDMHLILKKKRMKALITRSPWIKSCMSICFSLRARCFSLRDGVLDSVLCGICCDPLCWLIRKFWGWIKKIIGFPFNLMYSVTIFQLIMISHHPRRYQRCLSEIPNARHLRDAGFKFKKKTSTLCFLDVSHQGNTIHIPVLSIDASTLIHFQNLIAFEDALIHSMNVNPFTACATRENFKLRAMEKCNHFTAFATRENFKLRAMEKCNHFTAFATLMDCLIDTAEDVAILKERGIIENRLGDDEKVADFFNNLHRGIYIGNDHDYLGPLFSYVTNYYTSNSYKIRFYRWRNRLVPDYFSNPWAVPSMIAAFILLVLTVAQTFYTIYPYYHPKSNS